MIAKCPMCGKTIIALLGPIETCPRCGNDLSETKVQPDNRAETGLQFPQRENPSLEDELKRQLIQSYEGGSIGSSDILASWDDILRKRLFDAPFYTGLNNRACILIHFSSQTLNSEKLLEEILNSGRRLLLQIETFLRGKFPVVRCNLVIPDNPTDPFALEAPLNIRDGDVQDFCRAALADEYVDLIVKHEKSPSGRYYTVECHAPGLSMVIEREMKRTLRSLKPSAIREDFIASTKTMEHFFPTATAGMNPKKCIILTVCGKARNELIKYGDSRNILNR